MSIYTNDETPEGNDSVREQKLKDLSESLDTKAHALSRRAKELEECEAKIERTSLQVADLLQEIRFNSTFGSTVEDHQAQERYQALLEIIFNNTYVPDEEQPTVKKQTDEIMD